MSRPPLQTLSARAADRNLASAVKQAASGGARVVLTRFGVPAAALVSLADLELLERADAARATPAGGYDLEAVRRQLFNLTNVET